MAMGSRTEGKNAPVALNTEDIALLANGPGSSRNGSVNNVADNPDISIPAKGRPESGDQVRRRLGVCLFLHIVGGSIIMQIYPKVVLEYFNDDDGKASKFNGWLTFVSSALQLVAVPSLSGASDALGRKAVLGASLALDVAAKLALGFAPNSILAVSACQLVTGVCGAVLPVSQAIIIDLSHWTEEDGGGEVTHGLGLIGAAFGLAVSVGPILGGSLSELHRGTACVLCAAMSGLAILSLRFYGWKETAPERSVHRTSTGADESGGAAAGAGRKLYNWCSAWRVVNPFTILKVFMESRMLMELALCLFCFALALNVYSVYYNYFDFRYNWSALEISYFFSAFGVLLALTSGMGIRFLVPKRLTEGQGILLGWSLQGTGSILYGLAPRGWMLYPVLAVTTVQYITEPCIQAVMARLVGADRQGSLQGAVMSLRILAQGLAAPVYGQVFSFGLSHEIKKALGILLPGLPLFLSAAFSASGMTVAWFSLRNLGSSLTPSAEGTSTDASSDDSLEEGMGSVVAPFVDGGESATTLASTTLSSFAYPIPHEHHEGAAGAPAEEDGAMSDLSEPLLLSGDGPNGAYDS